MAIEAIGTSGLTGGGMDPRQTRSSFFGGGSHNGVGGPPSAGAGAAPAREAADSSVRTSADVIKGIVSFEEASPAQEVAGAEAVSTPGAPQTGSVDTVAPSETVAEVGQPGAEDQAEQIEKAFS
jgi:hypothetical protein